MPSPFRAVDFETFLQEAPGIRQKVLTAILKEEFVSPHFVSLPGSKPVPALCICRLFATLLLLSVYVLFFISRFPTTREKNS